MKNFLQRKRLPALNSGFYNSGDNDLFVTKINNLGTGILNLQSTIHNLQLFSNPATGTVQLTISTKHNAPLGGEILDVMGEKVYEAPLPVFPNEGEGSYAVLNVSFLAKGIYLVRVGDGERWENKKLMVVQRTPYGE